MRLHLAAVIAAATMICAVSASDAATMDAPVPTNAYIVKNGLDWAWASPLAGADLSYQGGLGWRLPTADELAFAPFATDFLFAGANAPFNGSDPISGSYFDYLDATYTAAASAGACAAAYFSSYTWCDWGNGKGEFAGPWAGMAGASGLADQLVVRVAAVTPIPAALPLFASALGGLGFIGWRRNKSHAA
jgi:hypothetical protein